MKKLINESLLYLIIIFIMSMIFYFVINSPFEEIIREFDYKVFSCIQSVNIVDFMKKFTKFGGFLIPFIIIIIVFVIKKEKKYTFLWIFGYIFSVIVMYIQKNIVARPRPVFAITTPPSSYSFPSGHTITSIVFYVLLAYIMTIKSSKKIKYLCLILSIIFSLVIGFSRIYLGVHFTSDVIGGIILAIPCLLMFINIINKYYRGEIK